MSGEPQASTEAVDVSIIIPVFNDGPTLAETCDRVEAVLDDRGSTHEIVLVDDGSTDGSWAEMRRLADGHRRIVAVRLTRNAGQTAAWCAGIGQAGGRRIVTLDADLDTSPNDVTVLLDAMDAGADAVNGTRIARHWRRALPSRAFNARMRRLGMPYTDMGCGMLGLSTEVARSALDHGDLRRGYRFKVLVAQLASHFVEVPVHAGSWSRSSYRVADLFSAGLEAELTLRRTILVWPGLARGAGGRAGGRRGHGRDRGLGGERGPRHRGRGPGVVGGEPHRRVAGGRRVGPEPGISCRPRTVVPVLRGGRGRRRRPLMEPRGVSRPAFAGARPWIGAIASFLIGTWGLRAVLAGRGEIIIYGPVGADGWRAVAAIAATWLLVATASRGRPWLGWLWRAGAVGAGLVLTAPNLGRSVGGTAILSVVVAHAVLVEWRPLPGWPERPRQVVWAALVPLAVSQVIWTAQGTSWPTIVLLGLTLAVVDAHHRWPEVPERWYQRLTALGGGALAFGGRVVQRARAGIQRLAGRAVAWGGGVIRRARADPAPFLVAAAGALVMLPIAYRYSSTPPDILVASDYHVHLQKARETQWIPFQPAVPYPVYHLLVAALMTIIGLAWAIHAGDVGCRGVHRAGPLLPGPPRLRRSRWSVATPGCCVRPRLLRGRVASAGGAVAADR
jgi:hypothetical protein